MTDVWDRRRRSPNGPSVVIGDSYRLKDESKSGVGQADRGRGVSSGGLMDAAGAVDARIFTVIYIGSSGVVKSRLKAHKRGGTAAIRLRALWTSESPPPKFAPIGIEEEAPIGARPCTPYYFEIAG